MRIASLRSGLMSAALGAGLLIGMGAQPACAAGYLITNLVSDGSVPAVTTDPNLINPWGISAGPTSPFWISDNGTGVSTLYNGDGTKVALTVAIAPATGGSSSAPTGQVFNPSTTDFHVTNGTTSGQAVFIFATEDGTISGWAPSVDFTHSLLAIDNSTTGLGAVYKGLALGNDGTSASLYAADFRNGLIDQYNSSFGLVRAFTDPTVAAGYAPFNTQVLDGHLFVTYALQDADKKDDVAGAGHGYVDEFNLDGSFNRRIVSLGGQINSPWGLDIAPANFGEFSGDLLVGNFGDGTISAFDLTSGTFEGKLADLNGDPIVLGDLWALINGNGGVGTDPNKVYFTAGLVDEAHGLFGSITAVPEPATWMTMILGMGLVGGMLRRRASLARDLPLATA